MTYCFSFFDLIPPSRYHFYVDPEDLAKKNLRNTFISVEIQMVTSRNNKCCHVDSFGSWTFCAQIIIRRIANRDASYNKVSLCCSINQLGACDDWKEKIINFQPIYYLKIKYSCATRSRDCGDVYHVDERKWFRLVDRMHVASAFASSTCPKQSKNTKKIKKEETRPVEGEGVC